MSTPSERVEAHLRERLRHLRKGEALPTVRELTEELGVSPSTVAKVLGILRAEGLITTKQGWGTFKAGNGA